MKPYHVSILSFVVLLIGLALLMDKLFADMTLQVWAAIVLIAAGLAL